MTYHCPFCYENNVVLDEDYHLAGCGETIERRFYCEDCDKSWNELWIYSCIIDNETGEII